MNCGKTDYYVFSVKWEVVQSKDGMFHLLEYVKNYNEQQWNIVELCRCSNEDFLRAVLIEKRKKDIESMMEEVRKRYSPPIDETKYFSALHNNQQEFFESMIFQNFDITEKVKEIWNEEGWTEECT